MTQTDPNASFITIPDIYLGDRACGLDPFVKKFGIVPFAAATVDSRIRNVVRERFMEHVRVHGHLPTFVPLSEDLMLDRECESGVATLQVGWKSDADSAAVLIPFDTRAETAGMLLLEKLRRLGLPILWSADVPTDVDIPLVHLVPHVSPLPFLDGEGDGTEVFETHFLSRLLVSASISSRIPIGTLPARIERVQKPAWRLTDPDYRFASASRPMSLPPPDELDDWWDAALPEAGELFPPPASSTGEKR